MKLLRASKLTGFCHALQARAAPFSQLTPTVRSISRHDAPDAYNWAILPTSTSELGRPIRVSRVLAAASPERTLPRINSRSNSATRRCGDEPAVWRRGIDSLVQADEQLAYRLDVTAATTKAWRKRLEAYGYLYGESVRDPASSHVAGKSNGADEGCTRGTRKTARMVPGVGVEPLGPRRMGMLFIPRIASTARVATIA
jgi:hypothetical protein